MGFLLWIGSVVCLSCMALVQTIWVISKHQKEREQELLRQREPSLRTSTLGGGESDSPNPRASILDLEIIDVIRETTGFESFMDHLAKEFSMENLLGIIEFTQYKQWYRDIRARQDGREPESPVSRRSTARAM